MNQSVIVKEFQKNLKEDYEVLLNKTEKEKEGIFEKWNFKPMKPENPKGIKGLG
jgi:hypothetical protein